VARACNPSYSGDRNQEDHGLKVSPRQIACETLSGKTLHNKRVNGLAQAVSAPE
jgi:hypothetical protein